MLRGGPLALSSAQVLKLQKGLAFSFVLAEKYRRTFRVFLSPCRDVVKDASAKDELAHDPLARCGWALYCLAKQRLLGSFADLTESVHLLVAVLAFLCVHAPDRLVSPFSNAAQFPVRAANAAPGAAPSAPASSSSCAQQPADVVGSLCLHAKAHRDAVTGFLHALPGLVVEALGAVAPPPVPWPLATAPEHHAPCGPCRLPGLLTREQGVAQVADSLSEAYDAAMRCSRAEVDERDFLATAASTSASGAAPGAALVGNPAQLTPLRAAARMRRGGEPGATTPHVQLRATLLDELGRRTGGEPGGAAGGATVMSPAGAVGRAVVQSAAWLRQATAPAADAPATSSDTAATALSPRLQQYLDATGDAAQLARKVVSRAQALALHLFADPPPGSAAVPPFPPPAYAPPAPAAALSPLRPGGFFVAGTGSAAAQAAEAFLFEGLAASAHAVVLGAQHTGALAAERRREVVALYLRQLELVLTKEEQRKRAGADAAAEAAAAAAASHDAPGAAADAAAPPGAIYLRCGEWFREVASQPDARAPAAPDFATLLSNEIFHRALLAICGELVARTHDMGATHAFPHCVQALHIRPLDISGLLPLLVDADPSLPRELLRHLNSIAESVIECRAWEPGSSLYDLLLRAKAAADTAPAPMVSGVSVSWGASGVGPPGMAGLPELPLCIGWPSHAEPLNTADASVRSFFTQVLILSALRLQKLSEKLGLPETLRHAALTAVKYALFEATHLLYGRHLDQLLMCCIYGAAKAAAWPRRDQPLPFREIILAYKALYRREHGLNATEDIYRQVVIEFAQPLCAQLEVVRRGDVIKYYNQAFIPVMKPHLLRTAAAAPAGLETAPEASPVASRLPFRSLPLSSPRQLVGAQQNVVLSPLRADRESALRSPRSGSFYAFLGESSQAMQSPGQDLAYINARVAAFSGGASLLADAAAAAAAAAVASYSPHLPRSSPAPASAALELAAAAALASASSPASALRRGARRGASPKPEGEQPSQRRRLMDDGE